MCPFYQAEGKCRYNITCRFAGKLHICQLTLTLSLSGCAPCSHDNLLNLSIGTHEPQFFTEPRDLSATERNTLSKKVQTQLWKRKYPYPRTELFEKTCDKPTDDPADKPDAGTLFHIARVFVSSILLPDFE